MNSFRLINLITLWEAIPGFVGYETEYDGVYGHVNERIDNSTFDSKPLLILSFSDKSSLKFIYRSLHYQPLFLQQIDSYVYLLVFYRMNISFDKLSVS